MGGLSRPQRNATLGSFPALRAIGENRLGRLVLMMVNPNLGVTHACEEEIQHRAESDGIEHSSGCIVRLSRRVRRGPLLGTFSGSEPDCG